MGNWLEPVKLGRVTFHLVDSIDSQSQALWHLLGTP